MRGPLLAVAALLAGCTSAEERRANDQKVARTAVAAESAKAAVATNEPATGKWDEAHLVERLVRSGLAPQALANEKSPPYWGVPLKAYRLGSATLHAYIYSDSTARLRLTAGLDSLTAAPKGDASPYPLPRLLLLQNNLAAVLLGGSDRQQDRVSLAIGAGLPPSSAP